MAHTQSIVKTPICVPRAQIEPLLASADSLRSQIAGALWRSGVHFDANDGQYGWLTADGTWEVNARSELRERVGLQFARDVGNQLRVLQANGAPRT